MRNKGEQVSENRFRAHQFEANVQTEDIIGKPKREAVHADTSTYSVKIQPNKHYASL